MRRNLLWIPQELNASPVLLDPVHCPIEVRNLAVGGEDLCIEKVADCALLNINP